MPANPSTAIVRRLRGDAKRIIGGIVSSASTAYYGRWYYSNRWHPHHALLERALAETVDYITANWMLPLGGLLIAIFTGFVLERSLREEEFRRGTTWGAVYSVWLPLLRYVVPLAVAVVFAQSSGLLKLFGIDWGS